MFLDRFAPLFNAPAPPDCVCVCVCVLHERVLLRVLLTHMLFCNLTPLCFVFAEFFLKQSSLEKQQTSNARKYFKSGFLLLRIVSNCALTGFGFKVCAVKCLRQVLF